MNLGGMAMATTLTKKAKEWMTEVSEFAVEHIAPLQNLHKSKNFPNDLWRKMGEEGLLGLMISKEFGGMGKSAVEMSLSANALAKDGGNLGIVLSFLIHQITAHYIIERLGSENQKKTWLPDLAQGKITACFAVSEPNIGAHPKYISTQAEKIKGGYVLNGEKSYLTNGPMADLFIVIAVTGNVSGKKRFSAFIVPKHSPGLEISDPMDISFFRPALHGGITMDHCEVQDDSVIASSGNSYEDIVLFFREIEDTLMMGAVTGALEKQARIIVEMVRKKIPVPDASLNLDLGKLKIMLDTARIISYESAAMLDSGGGHHEKTSLTLFFRDLAKDILVLLEIIIKNTKIEPSPQYQALTYGLTASSRIGGKVAELKQIKLGSLFYNGVFSGEPSGIY